MALWLELIPKIHRTEASSNALIPTPVDIDNHTLIVDRGSRQTDSSLSSRLPSASHSTSSSPSSYFDEDDVGLDGTLSSTSRPTKLIRSHSSPKTLRNKTALSTSVITLCFKSLRHSNYNDDATTALNAIAEESVSNGLDSDTTNLKVTVSIGFALFLVNITVFVATFYQWRRLNRCHGAPSSLLYKSPLEEGIIVDHHMQTLRYDAVPVSSSLLGIANTAPASPYSDNQPTAIEDKVLATVKELHSLTNHEHMDIEHEVAYPSTSV